MTGSSWGDPEALSLRVGCSDLANSDGEFPEIKSWKAHPELRQKGDTLDYPPAPVLGQGDGQVDLWMSCSASEVVVCGVAPTKA